MRRLAQILSITLPAGVILALIWPQQPVAEPQREESKPPRRELPKPEAIRTAAPRPAMAAAVHLPPPPAPKAPPLAPKAPPPKKIAVKPLKPVAPVKPKPAAAPPRPYLKPVPPALKPPELRVKPQPVRQPVAPPEKPRPAPKTVAPDAAAVSEGRTLLRKLEHGSGPAIEIAWPDSLSGQTRLYRRFNDCFGLRVAVLAGEDRLYIAASPPGAPWRPNLDAYSGFMRQHDASASQAEARELRRIRDRHSLPRQSAAVRIFPRNVDALLLGGLQQIVGADYAKRKTIRARYVLLRNQVFVEGVRADGRPIAGRIDLTPASRRACRTGGKA